ncbi:MAG: glycosyltransferase [Pyrinomonadaceae bacterium]
MNRMSKSRHKRIAHILPSPVIGGTEYGPLRIAQATGGDEFGHLAFHLEGAAAVREMYAAAGIETAAYKAVEPSYRRPKEFLRASLQLAREFRRRKIDLIHCADMLAAHRVGVAGKLARVPVVSHIRCLFDNLSKRDQSFLRAVDQFVFVSNYTWQHFGYKVSKNRGRVIYDGLDAADVDGLNDYSIDGKRRTTVRDEFGIPDEAKIIGMVARVAPVKDFATLARAARRITAVRQDVRFLIVGDCSGEAAYREYYRQVKQMLVANDVEQFFIFTDFQKDVARFIRAMDIFALCTHTEGLPLVVLEAMAHARPVVATAVGGVPEIIFDEETGLLHSHESDEQLAAKLLSLLNDEQRAARLGEAGRLFLQTNFNRAQFAANMTNFYREVLGIEARGAAGSYAAVNSLKQLERN